PPSCCLDYRPWSSRSGLCRRRARPIRCRRRASSSWTGPSGPAPRDIRRFLGGVSWWLIPLSLVAASAASLVENTSCRHVRSSRAPGKPEPEAGTRPGQAGDACGGSASLRDCFERSDELASLRHRPGVGQRLLKPRWQMADGERPPLLPPFRHLPSAICHLPSAICLLPSAHSP